MLPHNDQIKAGEIAYRAVQMGGELIKNSYKINARDVNNTIKTYIEMAGGSCPLNGYKPPFSKKAYEWDTCISLNNEAVHGPPLRVIDSEHDIVSIDLVVKVGDWCADTARTFYFGDNQEKQNFIATSWVIFQQALGMVSPNSLIDLYGSFIKLACENKYIGIVKELCGHGIGKEVHMEPQVLNVPENTPGITFVPGMAYALEPVLAIDPRYSLSIDKQTGWTVVANCLTSHFEDTLFIGKDKVYNLTGGV